MIPVRQIDYKKDVLFRVLSECIIMYNTIMT